MLPLCRNLIWLKRMMLYPDSRRFLKPSKKSRYSMA